MSCPGRVAGAVWAPGMRASVLRAASDGAQTHRRRGPGTNMMANPAKGEPIASPRSSARRCMPLADLGSEENEARRRGVRDRSPRPSAGLRPATCSPFERQVRHLPGGPVALRLPPHPEPGGGRRRLPGTFIKAYRAIGLPPDRIGRSSPTRLGLEAAGHFSGITRYPGCLWNLSPALTRRESSCVHCLLIGTACSSTAPTSRTGHHRRAIHGASKVLAPRHGIRAPADEPGRNRQGFVIVDQQARVGGGLPQVWLAQESEQPDAGPFVGAGTNSARTTRHTTTLQEPAAGNYSVELDTRVRATGRLRSRRSEGRSSGRKGSDRCHGEPRRGRPGDASRLDPHAGRHDHRQ